MKILSKNDTNIRFLAVILGILTVGGLGITFVQRQNTANPDTSENYQVNPKYAQGNRSSLKLGTFTNLRKPTITDVITPTDYILPTNTPFFLPTETPGVGVIPSNTPKPTPDDTNLPPPVPPHNCTLTIGFWKTHAGFGPQADVLSPLLPIWLGTPNGAKSIKVIANFQAVAILNKNDDASNGINRLYAQLLGTKLNISSGSTDSAVKSFIDQADLFLASYNANDWNSLSSAQKDKVNTWATKLDDYNNGFIGPGHCE